MLTSVIIPVRDGAHQLLYTLISLNLQFADFDKYEVIVLDNGSSSDTVLIRFEGDARWRGFGL
ncbi:Glyco_trans_2-like domain-containing protein [Brevibacillus sp. IT-7CA2]|uniref:glycosyltransferase family A protein n=1 Tax=Brevibacillus sp. IT-7CA2 TaxID=3026436 RepID=UPI0039E0ADCB